MGGFAGFLVGCKIVFHARRQRVPHRGKFLSRRIKLGGKRPDRFQYAVNSPLAVTVGEPLGLIFVEDSPNLRFEILLYHHAAYDVADNLVDLCSVGFHSVLALFTGFRKCRAELVGYISRRAADNFLHHIVYDGGHFLAYLGNLILIVLYLAFVAVLFTALLVDLLLGKVFELFTGVVIVFAAESLVGCVSGVGIMVGYLEDSLVVYLGLIDSAANPLCPV